MHSIWMTISGESGLRLSELISQIAGKTAGPLFQPHLTLASDLNNPVPISVQACETMFAGLSVNPASVTGVDGSDAYFMSLFLDISIPESVKAIRQKLAHLPEIGNLGPFRPHVSLAYGPVDERLKQELGAQIADDLIGYEFALTTVEVVESASVIPVQNWRSIWRRDLAPAEVART